jgi:hypothetical protein
MVEQGLLMFRQSVQASVKFMDIDKRETHAQKIAKRACVAPVSVKSPFAARIDQAITAKSLED